MLLQKIRSYLHLFCIHICICMHRKTVVRVGKGTPTWQSSFLESAGFYENWFCPPVPYHQHTAHSDHQGGQLRRNQDIPNIINRIKHRPSFLTSQSEDRHFFLVMVKYAECCISQYSLSKWFGERMILHWVFMGIYWRVVSRSDHLLGHFAQKNLL